MKFAALIVLAILGAANASLDDDLAELKALIPIDEIKAVTVEYAAHDAELQQVIAYLRSDKFLSIVQSIHDTPEWQELVDFVNDCGIDIHGFIQTIYDILLVDTFNVRSARPVQRGFHDWASAVMALIPMDAIKALIQEKLETSADFQELVARLKSDKFNAVVNAVASNSEWQELLQLGRDHGAPVDAWLQVVRVIFGWV